MPVANIKLLKGHPRAALRKILAEVSEAMSKTLGAPKDRLIVWIDEQEPHLRALNGAPADEALAHGSLAELETPFVQLVLMAGRPKEQFHALIASVTEIVASATGCDAGKVRVHVATADPEIWGIGGVPASVLRAAEIAARAKAAS